MDLWQVDFDDSWNATLTKIDGIHMYCDGCSFDYGSGIYIPPTGGFEVYAVAHQPDGDTIRVNRFTA